MKSIVERCVDVSAALDVTEEVQVTGFHLAALAEPRKQLQDLAVVLRKERGRAAALSAGLDQATTNRALASLGRVRSVLKSDPGRLVAGRTFKTLADHLGTLISRTRSETDRRLRDLQAEWSSTKEEYLELFSAIPELKSDCREGIKLLREVRDERTLKALTTPEAIAQFLGKETRLREIMALVDAFDCPLVIRQFLGRAQADGAPLAMLVPEVKDWLEKHDLLGKLKVRLA